MTRIWQPNNNPVIPGKPTGDKKPFWFFSTARRWTDSQDGMVGNRDMVTTMLLNYGSASAGPQKAPGKKPGDKNLCSLTNWGYKYVKHLAFLTSLEKNPKKFILPTWNLSRLRTWQSWSSGVSRPTMPKFTHSTPDFLSFWFVEEPEPWVFGGASWIMLNQLALAMPQTSFSALANHVDMWWIDLAWDFFLRHIHLPSGNLT